MGERCVRIAEAEGSNPLSSTIFCLAREHCGAFRILPGKNEQNIKFVNHLHFLCIGGIMNKMIIFSEKIHTAER